MSLEKLTPGTKLHAKFADGEFYPAEVVSVSTAKKWAKAPVLVHYIGYGAEDDTWLPVDNLKSKLIPKTAAPAAPPPKAKAKEKKKTAAPKKPGLPKAGIKLYYWPATGKAETIRLCFAEVGIPWEDVTFEKPSFNVYTNLGEVFKSEPMQKFAAECREKGGNLTTNLPTLEIGGKFYTQSTAVCRLVARKARLYPRQIETAFTVDNVVAHVEDAREPAYKVVTGKMEKDEFLTGIVKHLQNLERLLGDSDYFLAGSFTMADIWVFDLLQNMLVPMVPDILKDYPKLAAHREKVANREGIKAYLDSDQYKVLDKMVELK
jgi:glutathione S-transferase